jgi:hypothetical protein
LLISAPTHPTLQRFTPQTFTLRQSDLTGVRQSDHPQTAQFDPLEVGLNVGYDNPTHKQSDPFSASPAGLGDSSGDDTQMALLKNGTAPPERTSPKHGSAGCKLDLTYPPIWLDPPNRTPPKHGSVVSSWVGSTIPHVRLGQCMRTTLRRWCQIVRRV